MGFTYDRKKQLENQLQKIAREQNATNKRIILNFYESLRGQCHDKAMFKKMEFLQLMLRFLGKNRQLNRLTAKDFKDVILKIEERYAPHTAYTYLGCLKQFAKLYDKGRYWPMVSWKVRHRPKCSIKNADLITDDELKRMVEAAPNLKWKAFIEGLAFSRCRPGEFIGLRRRDVLLKDGEIIINLSERGKNNYSPREIIILESLPHFRKYVELINDQEQFLFPQLSYNAYEHRLHGIVRGAGINRRIWFYLFRHSRYTKDWEMGMRSETRNALYGHSATTKMNEYYLHLNQQSLRDDLVKVHNGNGNNQARCGTCGETRIIIIAPGLMYGFNN